MESSVKSKCPICKKPTVFAFRPFCSKRCADIDLAHWLREDYRIETDDEGEKKDSDEAEKS